MTEQDGKIKCELDGGLCHAIPNYLKKYHPEVSLEEYKERFPEAPLFSETAKEILKKRKDQEVPVEKETEDKTKKPLYEVFGYEKITPGMCSASGNPICITVLDKNDLPEESRIHIPEIDDGFVYIADILKTVMFAVESSIPTLIWGMQGAGKTTIIEQVCARTNRPAMRIQHSRDTEQSHIVGQWLVRDGATKFELGPLAVAMRHGFVYIADEYDFALPSVTALYQAVMEGGNLFIKEADAENRIIKPHPNFRFFATGNTNGSGDETGLFQGTMVQNAANYERFGMVIEAEYLPKEAEIRILKNKIGLDDDGASKLVRYANITREGFKNGEISIPMSPRSLLYAARIGIAFGNYMKGLERAYLGRLDSGSAATARESAQRIFK